MHQKSQHLGQWQNVTSISIKATTNIEHSSQQLKIPMSPFVCENASNCACMYKCTPRNIIQSPQNVLSSAQKHLNHLQTSYYLLQDELHRALSKWWHGHLDSDPCMSQSRLCHWKSVRPEQDTKHMLCLEKGGVQDLPMLSNQRKWAFSYLTKKKDKSQLHRMQPWWASNRNEVTSKTIKRQGRR